MLMQKDITNNENEAMNKYAEAVSELARNKRNNLLHNEGNAHALIIFTNIFNTAQHYIKIVAKDLLNIEVANKSEYIESLKSFLSKDGTRLEVLVSYFHTNLAKESPLFQMLFNSAAYQEKRISIKSLGGKSFRSADGRNIHFCIADDRMFRIETDIVDRKALCNFNDPDQTLLLNKRYALADSAPGTTPVHL